jgi:uncharacterized protein YhfF
MSDVTEFWRQFCEGTGSDLTVSGTFAFGKGKAQQDELCALMLAGTKCATASLALWYGQGRATMDKPGDLWIVLDGTGTPRAVIEIVAVEESAFDEVDAAFAAAEGEGDGSLAYWRNEHERFFVAELAAEGLNFAPTVRVVCERFRLLWAPSIAAQLSDHPS